MSNEEKFVPMTEADKQLLELQLFESYLAANTQRINELDAKSSAQVATDIAKSMIALLQNQLLIEQTKQTLNYNIHNSPSPSLQSVSHACQILTKQLPWVVPLGRDTQRYSLLIDATTHILYAHTPYYPHVHPLEKPWSLHLEKNIIHETAHAKKAQELNWECCGCLEFDMKQEGLGCRAGVFSFPKSFISQKDYMLQKREITEAVGADLSDRDREILNQTIL